LCEFEASQLCEFKESLCVQSARPVLYNIIIIMLYCIRRTFDRISKYCVDNSVITYLTFVVSFYLSTFLSRFITVSLTLPLPDCLALYVTASIKGSDDRGRLIRRTLMRYMNLGYVLAMRTLSTPVRRRFRHLQQITDAGRCYSI